MGVEKCQTPRGQDRTKPPAAYLSEFAGMVGSMETMASSVVSREMVVFLEDRPSRRLHMTASRGRTLGWASRARRARNPESRSGLVLQTRRPVCK